MTVSIKVDPVSFKKLNKRFNLLGIHYPRETYRAVVSILFDMKLIAQRKLKSDGHIVTGRLRNSIFVKTPKQQFANRSGNRARYSFPGGIDKNGRKVPGGQGNADLNVNLRQFEGAVGTNVVYAQKIEDLDSYIEYASKNVDVNKRLRQIPENARKKIK
jgi:hypothetical protein